MVLVMEATKKKFLCLYNLQMMAEYTIPGVLMALKSRFPSELKLNVYLH